MTGCTVPSSDGLLAEVYWSFLSFKQKPRDMCTAPRIISLSPLSLATDVTDATLGASGIWLGTRTGAGGTATLTENFPGRSPWLHGQQAGRSCVVNLKEKFSPARTPGDPGSNPGPGEKIYLKLTIKFQLII